ncbi:hypothetical protein [Arthrobacter sp. NEB 688]|uniref:TY-Chap domain-containing protein n=1 Tax=Arthrobacter sp. NEB 688 TaxID=904039 RepID=UPI00156518CE|nr:hypothetical protein [Arthrobacter sp. NEB 688]QKE85455.1 hypothetical protein HL663_16975 [Arthrobacter sp. NEB 688]
MTAEHAAPSGAAGPTTWSTWEDALVVAVRGLADGASLTVTAPPGHERMARSGSRLRWLLGGGRRPVAPFVRLVRAEDHLRGHWVGSPRAGGSFPWTREEEERLLADGWHVPTATDGKDFVRFWPDDVPSGPFLPEGDARRAAAAVGASFRDVLGVTPDGGSPASGLPAVRPDTA